jgi:hypothetical protein
MDVHIFAPMLSLGNYSVFQVVNHFEFNLVAGWTRGKLFERSSGVFTMEAFP